MNNYSILGRNIIPFSVGVYVAWQSFARANDVSPDNLCVQLTNVCMHEQVPVFICMPRELFIFLIITDITTVNHFIIYFIIYFVLTTLLSSDRPITLPKSNKTLRWSATKNWTIPHHKQQRVVHVRQHRDSRPATRMWPGV